jgi:hypothetical protein
MNIHAIRSAAIVVGALALLTGCASPAYSTKLLRISTGMKTAQVETILGRPTRIDHSEITGLTGQVYHYISASGDGRVVFVNDAVFETDFVPAGAHA